MDFISLATEQHRLLRFLDEMLGEDDPPETARSEMDVLPAPSPMLQDAGAMEEGVDEVRPIFSHNAEMELYQLATNFLLYVALVIVVILVCRIYFPECLIARKPEPRRGNYKYRVAEEQNENFEEDDDEEEEELLASSSTSSERRGFQSQASFLEFQQERLSRTQVLQRLAFCSILLNVTFVVWGALQVRSCGA